MRSISKCVFVAILFLSATAEDCGHCRSDSDCGRGEFCAATENDGSYCYKASTGGAGRIEEPERGPTVTSVTVGTGGINVTVKP